MDPRSNHGQLMLEVILMVTMMLGVMYLSVKLSDISKRAYTKHEIQRTH